MLPAKRSFFFYYCFLAPSLRSLFCGLFVGYGLFSRRFRGHLSHHHPRVRSFRPRNNVRVVPTDFTSLSLSQPRRVNILGRLCGDSMALLLCMHAYVCRLYNRPLFFFFFFTCRLRCLFGLHQRTILRTAVKAVKTKPSNKKASLIASLASSSFMIRLYCCVIFCVVRHPAAGSMRSIGASSRPAVRPYLTPAP